MTPDNAMQAFAKIKYARLIMLLFISSVVWGLVIGIRQSKLLENLELSAYDWLIRMRPDAPAADARIVVLGINENDIRQLGSWPLTDADLAQIINSLMRHRPRVIGLDIFRDKPVPPGSKALEAALRQHRAIIATSTFGPAQVPPPPILKDSDRYGFNDILVDPGGTVRRALLFLDDGSKVFYSFALKVALHYLADQGIAPQPDPNQPRHLRLGQTTIPPFGPDDGGYIQADARGYQFLIKYLGRDAASFHKYSLKEFNAGSVDPGMIRNKIVLIGITAHSVKDFFYTPYSLNRGPDQQTSGIVLHAHIIRQLLDFGLDSERPLSVMNESQEVLWILFWSLLGGSIGLSVRSPLLFAIGGLGGLILIGSIAYLAMIQSWWIPSVPPALAWVMSAAVVMAYTSGQEKKQRAFLMQLFSRHVSKEVAETIWRQRDQFLEDGRPKPQKAEVTVLFADLAGFTSVSEELDPHTLIQWLNTFMDAMAQLVMRNAGIVDDYAGDGIKANFGVPILRRSQVEIGQDALNAVTCALQMKTEMSKLNRIWQNQNLPTAGIRIGICTGSVIVGALGSSQRMKYTTVGDTVNIASRLESFEKEQVPEGSCRTLIAESTRRYVQEHFKLQTVGAIQLKGKKQTAVAYRVIDEN